MESAWATGRPQDVTYQLRFLPTEEFSLGGLYGFGGPLYKHSCIDARSDPPSEFLVRDVRAVLRADSLVIISGTMAAIDTMSIFAWKVSPSAQREAIPL